jgi:hypothetical protein
VHTSTRATSPPGASCWRGRTAGTFNAVTPPLPMARLLDACLAATGSDAQFIRRPDAEVVAAGIAPRTGLPLWLPEDDPAFGGMMLGDGARAAAAGLVHRPLIDTVRDTADWAAHDPGAMRAPKGGLDAAAEAAALSPDIDHTDGPCSAPPNTLGRKRPEGQGLRSTRIEGRVKGDAAMAVVTRRRSPRSTSWTLGTTLPKTALRPRIAGWTNSTPHSIGCDAADDGKGLRRT